MNNFILPIGGKDESGNAKSIEILNGAVKIKEMNRVGKEPVHHLVRQTVLQGDETLEVLKIEHPIEVQHLVWGVSHKDVQFSLSVFNSSGQLTPIGDIQFTVGSVVNSVSLTPDNIINSMVDLFNVNLYENGKYKFSLSRPMSFPYGFTISFENKSSVPQNIGLRLYGVEQDV